MAIAGDRNGEGHPLEDIPPIGRCLTLIGHPASATTARRSRQGGRESVGADSNDRRHPARVLDKDRVLGDLEPERAQVTFALLDRVGEWTSILIVRTTRAQSVLIRSTCSSASSMSIFT